MGCSLLGGVEVGMFDGDRLVVFSKSWMSCEVFLGSRLREGWPRLLFPGAGGEERRWVDLVL